MRAFYRNGYLYSYKLRRANAEAYLLDNMEPVINDGELIVGLPDLSPLTAEEQKEYDELAKGMNFVRGERILTLHIWRLTMQNLCV